MGTEAHGGEAWLGAVGSTEQIRLPKASPTMQLHASVSTASPFWPLRKNTQDC